MGETYRKKIDIKPADILRNGTTHGFVKINQVDGPPIELRFTSNTITNSTKTSPSYLLAYGSTRLFPTKKIKPELTKGRVRARNLFTPDTALFADNWLLSMRERNKKKFDYAARALKSLLSKEIEDPELKLIVKANEVWVQYSDPKRLPDKLRSLSDGYKSIIALACDMMQALMEGNSTMEVVEGIVLLDEIGTHLHPRWKMRVVNSFRAAFPKLQFIVTTHDPLCLKGLFGGEIAIFDKDLKGKVYAISDMPDPGEFRADQLLSSRFFGLNSTIDDELEKEFDKYYSLLGRKEVLNKKEQKRLSELTDILKGKQHLGNSLREELAYNAVDQLLAKEKIQETHTPVEVLKEQTLSMLQKLWNKTTEEQKKLIKA
ncbi:MAG: ATP-binding protein [Chryseobacterium sp.]|nr:MAG: ATP-binding protein [Chryseobacterium sp.]